MREILFRGKRKDNGAWETGSLVRIRVGCSDEQVFIADKMTGHHTPVIPETVGEYTGLKDSKDKMIFEGDVVKCYEKKESFIAEVQFGAMRNGTGEWGFYPRYKAGSLRLKNSILPYISSYYEGLFSKAEFEKTGIGIEVIGNIYDTYDFYRKTDERMIAFVSTKEA